MPKRVLSPELPKRGKWAVLSDAESHHALNVLRLSDGEVVEVLDGEGHLVMATLRIRGGQAHLEYLVGNDKPVLFDRAKTVGPPVTLEMAVLKGDAMEWVVEKAVELGVDEFIPVLVARTVVQIEKKGAAFFQNRWQKIADQTLKQCGRLDRMVVHQPTALAELVPVEPTGRAARLWCDESSSEASLEKRSEILEWFQFHSLQFSEGVRILVGPEGGWDPPEREWLGRKIQGEAHHRISLGPLILRAETAAIFAISLAVAFRQRR